MSNESEITAKAVEAKMRDGGYLTRGSYTIMLQKIVAAVEPFVTEAMQRKESMAPTAPPPQDLTGLVPYLQPEYKASLSAAVAEASSTGRAALLNPNNLVTLTPKEVDLHIEEVTKSSFKTALASYYVKQELAAKTAPVAIRPPDNRAWLSPSDDYDPGA